MFEETRRQFLCASHSSRANLFEILDFTTFDIMTTSNAAQRKSFRHHNFSLQPQMEKVQMNRKRTKQNKKIKFREISLSIQQHCCYVKYSSIHYTELNGGIFTICSSNLIFCVTYTCHATHTKPFPCFMCKSKTMFYQKSVWARVLCQRQ